ncbi:Uncharacterised protein [Raoultella planticola]|uniref:Uncharacterized protein n=1 Tax=Raoultella planticola TaxID=575 RepID=A0A485CVU8_RAOPL|nr:Uncharacterised protein [Raoultella planticola]
MPPERFNFADQRHLGGAFQDNRMIPYEGICVAEFSPAPAQDVNGDDCLLPRFFAPMLRDSAGWRALNSILRKPGGVGLAAAAMTMSFITVFKVRW